MARLREERFGGNERGVENEGEDGRVETVGGDSIGTGIKRRATNKAVTQNANTTLNIGGQGLWPG